MQSNFLYSACYKKGVKEKLTNHWKKNQVHCMLRLMENLKGETVRFSVLSLGKSKSNQGWTPLHLAAYFGHKNVVQVLLEVCHLDNIKAVL